MFCWQKEPDDAKTRTKHAAAPWRAVRYRPPGDGRLHGVARIRPREGAHPSRGDDRGVAPPAEPTGQGAQMNLGQLRALVARHAGNDDDLEVLILIEQDEDYEPTRCRVVGTIDAFIEDDFPTF